MMDSSNSDSKELIIDYMLSWTLRMSCVYDDGYNNKVKGYCTQMLSKIVFDDLNKIRDHYNFIKSVKIWRQRKRIDLWAEIELIDKEDKVSYHALLIESKAYSCIHHDQLNTYKKIFEENYKGTAFEKNLHYAYFTIKERKYITSDEEACRAANFLCHTMDEIMDAIWPNMEDFKPTGNEIFDEFWIKSWG